MAASVSRWDRRAENKANGKHDARTRRPLMLIVSAAVASVVIGTVIVAGAAMLNYKPVQEHVEFEITPPNKQPFDIPSGRPHRCGK